MTSEYRKFDQIFNNHVGVWYVHAGYFLPDVEKKVMPKPPNRDKMPELCFIGPGRNKARFDYVVFIVKEKDLDGTPRQLELLLPDESVKVEDGMEFMTGYIPHKMIPQPKG